MNSRPRFRMYAALAGSLTPDGPSRSESATDCPAHGVAHYHVLVGERLLQRLHRQVTSNPAECHGSARSHFAIVPLAENSAGVEDVRENGHAFVSADRAVAVEERHFFRKSALAQLACAQMALDSLERAAMPPRAKNFHCR